MRDHTVLGWTVWVLLILSINGAAFLFAVGVPIFNYLIGIAASLFASWYTYGMAGFFWLHDSYHDGDGVAAWRKGWGMTTTCMLTIVVGGFICVAGLYSNIDGVIIAYRQGTLPAPFSC